MFVNRDDSTYSEVENIPQRARGGGALLVRTKIYKPLHLVSADFSCFLLLLVLVIIH
jgi:hypothetical protein